MRWLCALMLMLVMPVGAARASDLYGSVRTGTEQFEKQQYEEALKTFLDAQVKHPDNAALKYDIASTHYKMRNYEEAVKGYMDVVATARDAHLEAQALYNLGNATYRQGKLDDAVEYYKKTLELDPQDEDARKNLEFVREEIKRRQNEARETQQRQQSGGNKKEDKPEDKQDQKQGQQGQQQGQQQDQQQGQQGQQKDQQQGQPEGQKDGNRGAQQDSQQQNAQGGSQESQQGKSSESQQAGEQASQDQARQGGSDGGPDERKQNGAGAAGQEDGRQQAGEDMQDIAAGGRPMSAEEAKQWLDGLEESREKFKQHQQQSQPGQRRKPEKDW